MVEAAVATANGVKNRSITKGLSEGTSFKKWTGKRPDISHFHIFSEKVFILDKTPNKNKFEPKGKQGIFIGYSDCSKGYQVWVPKDHKVQISRDVKFCGDPEPRNEQKFVDVILEEQPLQPEKESQNKSDEKNEVLSNK